MLCKMLCRQAVIFGVIGFHDRLNGLSGGERCGFAGGRNNTKNNGVIKGKLLDQIFLKSNRVANNLYFL